MKRLLLSLIVAITACSSLRAADGDIFPYPVPPEDMVTLGERCDYLVTHFWDRCDFKSAFSTMDKLNNTFGDWISFMPYATADSVHMAIERLLQSVKKSGQHTLGLARMAEGWCYSDTGFIVSDEIYYPFAKAVANSGKIKGDDKEHFKKQVQIIENTYTTGRVERLEYVTIDGEKHSLDETRTQIIILMFGDYESDNCALSRIRLSADINATALIKAGLLTVINIQPSAAGDEWRGAASSYPADWVNGASADAPEYFPLRRSPEFYLLDSRHRILAKNFDIEGLLNALTTLRANTGI